MKENKSSLDVTIIHDGIVLPCKKDFKNKGWGKGGVISSDFLFIPESGLYSKWSSFGGIYDFSKAKIKKIDEDVIWFGFFYKHWGHFLLDFVSRMWLLLNDYNGQKIIYVSHGDIIDGNYMEFLNLLGVDSENVVRVESLTQFTSIVIPDYSKRESEYHDYYLRLMSTVAKAAKESSIGSMEEQEKIYFSRMAFKDASKKEFGEKYIEDLMTSAGYKIFYPEKMTLKEQIFLWDNAKSIACINGTIPLNLIFSANYTQDILILNKAKIHHQNLADIIDIKKIKRLVIINSYYDKFASKAKSLGEGPFFLSVTDELIAKLGLKSYYRNNIMYNFNAHFFLYRFIVSNKIINLVKKTIKKILTYIR